MGAGLEIAASMALLVVIYLVVLVLLKGAVVLGRTGTVQLPRRVVSLNQPFDQVLAKLTVDGWTPNGAISERGDVQLENGALKIMASPSVVGGVTLAFVGMKSSRRAAPDLESKLVAVFAE